MSSKLYQLATKSLVLGDLVYVSAADGSSEGKTTFSAIADLLDSGYNPAAVAITGGAINGTAIGNTAVAMGAFSNLTAVNFSISNQFYGNLSLNSGYIRFAGSTVAALPAASSAPYAIDFVTDAASFTSHGVVIGGGSVKTPVYSDGANWLMY